jgi:hypothetical protein
MASRGGRVVTPGCSGGRSFLSYKCKAVGCSVTPRGKDLKKHYLVNTDWNLVAKLRAALGDIAVDRLRKKADAHTQFIYSKGYSKERMPTFATHVSVKDGGGKVVGEEAEGVSGQQQTIGAFFQVS